MRSFVMLLLLVVVFLVGMLIGIDKEKQTINSELQAESIPLEIPVQSNEFVDESGKAVNEKTFDKLEDPEQTTQKMAFFLEAIVKGFYEIVVEVLYQISSLFV